MLGLLAAVVMIYNLHTVFIKLPDEVMQGAVYRIMFVHVPAASVAHLFYSIALVCGVLFLKTEKFLYDAISVACVEVATMYLGPKSVGHMVGLGSALDHTTDVLPALSGLSHSAPGDR
jgi:ABC-type transport system involved in cytochrome c biogenesis permease subunit